ncbi:meteorin-like protein [Aricia agestis]|uniref:meteorin-like protein n=1 Tax=Aricia agestis TaxID=91739 RepID=UPI001C20207F|nr:meteorin-like protein [Aricia agestis]XP_041978493.1 meteorin-like protein [Aricia agestis]
MSEGTMFLIVLGLICVAEAGSIGDQCDWTGSGLTVTAERAVTPVYLRCQEGTISWKYPRGALRLIFKPPLPLDERDFQVCIRVIRRPDPPDIFHALQENDTGTVERFPARLFREGVRKLLPLYASDDGDVRELRCFRSKHGRAALYVEAEPEEGTKKRMAIFKYEAKPLVRRHYDPATADCRPCSESELELAFCTSDLVSRGVIVETKERQDLDTTQLTWKLTKIIRATGMEDNNDIVDTEYYRYDVENSIAAPVRRRRAHSHAHVQVRAACGAAGGAGEFIIMARRRLGRLALTCAPRASEWDALVEKRRQDPTANCLLLH